MRAQFEKLILDLKSNEIVTLIRADIGKPVDKNILKSIMAQFNLEKIPEIMMEYHSEVGYIDIRWELNIKEKGLEIFNPDDAELSGEIRVRPFESLFMEDEKYTNTFKEDFTNEDAEDLPHFRPLDYEDSFVYGLLKKGSQIPETLWYIQNGSDGFGMAENITLQKYFDSLYKYKGFNGWQHNIALSDTGLKRMKHYIDQIF